MIKKVCDRGTEIKNMHNERVRPKSFDAVTRMKESTLVGRTNGGGGLLPRVSKELGPEGNPVGTDRWVCSAREGW